MKINNKIFLCEKLPVLIIILILYCPIIYLFILSFTSSDGVRIYPETITLQWYRDLLNNSDLLHSAVVSLIVATISSITCTMVSALAAAYIYLWPNNRISKSINMIQSFILMTPDIIVGITILFFFSKLGMQVGYASLITSHTVAYMGVSFLIIRSKMSSIKHSIIEASMDLGANTKQIVFAVLLPSCKDAIISSIILIFGASIDDVVISYFTSGPESATFTVFLYSSFRFGSPMVLVMACSLLMVAAVLFIILYYLLRSDIARKMFAYIRMR